MSSQRRRARLTRRGIAMLIGGTVILAGGAYLRVGELLALGACGVVLPIVAWGRVRAAGARAEVEVAISHTPARPVRGRPVTIRATLRNRSRRTLLADVSVGAPFVAEPPRASVRVPRGGVETVSSTSDASRRGRHRSGPVECSIGDGIGLAAVRWNEPAGVETIVLPAFTPVTGAPTLPPEENASGPARRSPMRGTEFHSLREYQRGDDLRQVHWRASAKHGSLLVRELEPLAMPRFTILLDDRRGSRPDPGRFELGVSLAASVAAGLSRRGSGIRLVTSEARVGAHEYGSAALERIVERLALAEASLHTSLVEAARRSAPPGRGGGLVLIAPPIADDASMGALLAVGRRFGWAGAIVVEAGDDDGSGTASTLRSAGWHVTRVSASGNARIDRSVPEEAWRQLLASARR